MKGGARMALLGLATAAAGCSYSACIYEDRACIDTVHLLGSGSDEVFACVDAGDFTTCKDEGFTYDCNDVWYRLPCP